MFNRLAQVQTAPKENQVLSVIDFRHGLNSFEPPDRIAQTEASEIVNWMIIKGGRVVTRNPITAYTANATTSNAAVKYIARVVIGGTAYTLVVDSNYVLYYIDAGLLLQTIGTLEGETTIQTYNGVAVLFDGSYLKYLDSVSEIKMAYDAGSGTAGYQVDKSSLTDNTYLALGNGTNLGVAQKFTTQAWTAGYTIPTVTVSAYLSENGSAPAGAVTAKIRKFSDASVIASKVLVADASVIGGTATQYTATFSASDVTAGMSPSTAYFASIEYSAGDAANYVKVHCYNIGSAGLSYYGVTSLSVIGNWAADTAKDCLIAVGPGRPPKGKFGAVFKNRLFMAGDTDNPGYLRYSNLTHLDWSTASGGGYLGVIDDNKDSFEVGGILPLYGNLYVFGKQSQPYLVQLSGEDPTDFAQAQLYQKPWSTHKTLISAVNDLWYGSAEGVAPLSGVQEYGDVRTYFASDPVLDRFNSYWNTANSIAAYYPADGQYWIAHPTYHRVLVCHTKLVTQEPNGTSPRYPWSEYEFYSRNFTDTTLYKWTASGSGTNEYYLELLAGGDPLFVAQPNFITLDGKKITEGTVGSLANHQWDYGDNDTLGYNTVYIRDESGDPDASGVDIRSIFLPTAMADCGGVFLLGGSDGIVYKIDLTEYKDQGSIQISPIIQTAYFELPFASNMFHAMQLLASSKGGGILNINFFTDYQHLTPTHTETITVGMRDDLTVNDMTWDVVDWVYPINTSTSDPLFTYINFNARMVMVKIDSVRIIGYPIYLNGVFLKYRGLAY